MTVRIQHTFKIILFLAIALLFGCDEKAIENGTNESLTTVYENCVVCDSSFKAECLAYQPTQLEKGYSRLEKRYGKKTELLYKSDNIKENVHVLRSDVGIITIAFEKKRGKKYRYDFDNYNISKHDSVFIFSNKSKNIDTIINHESGLTKSDFRGKYEHYSLQIKTLLKFPSGEDTLTITIKKSLVQTNKNNQQDELLKRKTMVIQFPMVIPKIYETVIFIDSTKINKDSAQFAIGHYESGDPDLGVRLQMYEESIYSSYLNNSYSLNEHTPFKYYLTANNPKLNFKVYDDDLLIDHIFLSKEVLFTDILTSQYFLFKNDCVEHSGIKALITSVVN